jgi:hypothetical protein
MHAGGMLALRHAWDFRASQRGRQHPSGVRRVVRARSGGVRFAQTTGYKLSSLRLAADGPNLEA